MLLATLAAQTLAPQTLTTPAVDITAPPQTKEAGSLIVSDATEKAIASRPSNTIASPESVLEQEFSPRSSQSSTIESKPNTQAASTSIKAPETERMLAQATPQNARSLPVLQPAVSQEASASMLADVQSNSARDLLVVPAAERTSIPQETANSRQTGAVVAQATQKPSQGEVERVQDELRSLEELETEGEFRASPALSIYIPTGFGLDNNTGFITATYQERTRYSGGIDDGGLGIGIGLGDAREAVGVELSYTLASFGSNRDFGSGGFNAKVHRQLSDSFSVAAGWNGFLNIGDDNDFENSLYGVATKIFRTREDIDSLFSRVAVTAGIGSGQFRTENAVEEDRDNINVFGNVAIRVARPVSLIAEWSGQDLGVGLSIAPFKNIPLVITPAVRDITGAGDGTRFVLGTGLAFRF
mgnify:CR=1 FL=1